MPGLWTTSLIRNPIKLHVYGEGTTHVPLIFVLFSPTTTLTPATSIDFGVICHALLVRKSLFLDHKKESEEKHYGKNHFLILANDIWANT